MPSVGEERPRGEALLRKVAFTALGPGTLGQRQAVDGPGQTLLGGEGGTHLGGPWILYELSFRHFLSSSASKNNCAVNGKRAEPPLCLQRHLQAFSVSSFTGACESDTGDKDRSQGRNGLRTCTQQVRQRRFGAETAGPVVSLVSCCPQAHIRGGSCSHQAFINVGVS